MEIMLPNKTISVYRVIHQFDDKKGPIKSYCHRKKLKLQEVFRYFQRETVEIPSFHMFRGHGFQAFSGILD